MTETVKGCPTYHICGTAFLEVIEMKWIAFTKYSKRQILRLPLNLTPLL